MKKKKDTEALIKNLLENNDEIISEKKNEFWECARVKSGKQLEVAYELTKKKVPFFIPLYRKGSKKNKPLITGYIFLRIPKYRRANIAKLGIKYLEVEGPLSYRNFIKQVKRLSGAYEIKKTQKLKTGATKIIHSSRKVKG